MKKHTPLLIFGFFVSLALALVLCTLTVWSFMSGQNRTVRLIMMLGAFFLCSAAITILTLLVVPLLSGPKNRKKNK